MPKMIPHWPKVFFFFFIDDDETSLLFLNANNYWLFLVTASVSLPDSVGETLSSSSSLEKESRKN